ncbi:hypothetical protein NFI96_008607 [Prochilodus magdalenae]|nr:hypothetical protein NFI96_008607 [Prochilodus magdalenae]
MRTNKGNEADQTERKTLTLTLVLIPPVFKHESKSSTGPPQDPHRAGMMWVVDHSQHCSDTSTPPPLWMKRLSVLVEELRETHFLNPFRPFSSVAERTRSRASEQWSEPSSKPSQWKQTLSVTDNPLGKPLRGVNPLSGVNPLNE